MERKGLVEKSAAFVKGKGGQAMAASAVVYGPVHHPPPISIVTGRRFYDAAYFVVRGENNENAAALGLGGLVLNCLHPHRCFDTE